jgi:zinc protease
MFRSLSVFLVGGALLGAPAVPVSAQEAPPSGREVINRFIEALGGREAILAQDGRHIFMKLAIPAQGMNGDLEVYTQPPNKMLATVAIAGIGEMRQGFDGTTGWMMNPMMGPMVLDSLQLQQMRQNADMYSNLYPEEMIASLETVGTETFEGATCYNVKVTTTWGESYNEYFDTTTGLQVGTRRQQESPMGQTESITIVSDYRELAGLKAPFKTVVRTMGVDQVLTVDSAKVVTVPDSVFALPPEIQALLKK